MAYNVIWVGPADGSNHKPLTVEGTAGATILPGTLVAQTGDDIAKSTNDGTTASRLLLAREFGEQFGKKITDPITTGQHIVCVAPRSGEFFNVCISASQTLVVGDALTSAGDGTFKKAGAGDAIYCYAQVASNNAANNTLILATV